MGVYLKEKTKRERYPAFVCGFCEAISPQTPHNRNPICAYCDSEWDDLSLVGYVNEETYLMSRLSRELPEIKYVRISAIRRSDVD